MAEEAPLDAGDAKAWLAATDAVLAAGAPAAVPCGSCTACCRAAQFILVTREETDALAAIPSALLFPAPGRPGDYVLGHDAAGHCPMFDGTACTIYAARPHACRTYDCRVFAATATFPDTPEQREVAAHSRRWRFAEARPVGALQATRAAARFLTTHRDALADVLRNQPLAIALAAIQVRSLFRDGSEPAPAEVRAALRP